MLKARLICVTVLVFGLCQAARADGPPVAERVAALKQVMAESQGRLKQYEWIETTVVSVKGDEKSRQQHRCYYGADGQLTKVVVGAPPAEEPQRGLRGRIKEKKKEEMTQYMTEAVALVKSYVPPSHSAMEAAKEAGKASVEVIEPGKRVRLVFRDYARRGDSLGIEVDLKTNRPVAFTVSTWLNDADDRLAMTAVFGALNDGTLYTDQIRLTSAEKKLTVAVDNSGYRKLEK